MHARGKQEKGLVFGNGDAEVIAYPFRNAVMCGRAQRQCQICAQSGYHG
jgi:hypothetical protein